MGRRSGSGTGVVGGLHEKSLARRRNGRVCKLSGSMELDYGDGDRKNLVCVIGFQLLRSRSTLSDVIPTAIECFRV